MLETGTGPEPERPNRAPAIARGAAPDRREEQVRAAGA